MIKKTYNGYSAKELSRINKEIMQIKNRSQRKIKRLEIRKANPKLGIALAMYSLAMMVDDGIFEKFST